MSHSTSEQHEALVRSAPCCYRGGRMRHEKVTQLSDPARDGGRERERGAGTVTKQKQSKTKAGQSVWTLTVCNKRAGWV